MEYRRNYEIDTLVKICGEIYRKGWVANHDGNVTVRYDDTILATPTAISKADMSAEIILTLDKDGNKLAGIGKPFSELTLHLAAYRSNGDIGAVVHAHPPYATARGLVGGDFEVALPEAVVSIGDSIPVTPYAFPGSAESEAAVAAALGRSFVFMMAGNGVLAVGRNVKEAFLRMELLEHLVKIDHYARAMGTITPIPGADKQKLLAKRAAAGLAPKDAGVSPTPAAPSPPGSNPPVPPASQSGEDVIKDLVAQELRKILKEK